MSLTIGQIEAAANWWAEVVGAPKFDNGDPLFNKVMTTHDVEPVANSQKGMFFNAMREELFKWQSNYLGCDYSPDQLLARAAVSVGIPTSNFPCKTSMWLTREGTVDVRYGYGAKTVQIYPVIS